VPANGPVVSYASGSFIVFPGALIRVSVQCAPRDLQEQRAGFSSRIEKAGERGGGGRNRDRIEESGTVVRHSRHPLIIADHDTPIPRDVSEIEI